MEENPVEESTQPIPRLVTPNILSKITSTIINKTTLKIVLSIPGAT